MELRNRATGAVITDSQFRAEHSGVSFPRVLTTDILAHYNYDPILEGPQAVTIPPYQSSVRDGIEQINGQWFTRYIAIEPDADGKARMDDEQAERMRTDRNKRLADCDWTQLPDAPVDSAAWAVYRQALRDVTAQPGFPWNVEWPSLPS